MFNFNLVRRFVKEYRFKRFLSKEDISYFVDSNGAITVDEELYLNLSRTKELPDSLTVNGFLDISYTNIKELPDSLTVNGSLDISNTGITKLPDTLNCGSLYLDHKKITNIAYRENCGMGKRTIFAVNTKNGIMISAGCFLNTLTEFEIVVDLKYMTKSYKRGYYRKVTKAYKRSHIAAVAKAYKNKARECVAELTTMLTAK